jgi:amino acid transporter
VTAPAAGLSRRALGGFALWLFAVGASSPMTVLAASVPATYAGTGVVGVPLSFLLLGPALALLTVGYVAVARHVQHAAPIYAVLTHGLGRLAGVAGAAEAVMGYNAIQICLYGLIGVTLSGFLGGTWWVWALLVWLLIGVLGVFNVRLNAAVLGWLLGVELLLIAVFDLAALTHPAGGHLTGVPLAPSSLAVDGIGGALALGIAAFVGYEQPPVFVEEARRVSAVVRGTFAALGFLSVFYALSAWALVAVVGPGQVVTAAQNPDFAFNVMQQVFGPLWGVAMATLGRLLLVTSMFAAMLAFHNSVARHLFALGREGVIPRRLGQAGAGTGRRSGAPVAASLTQSALAFVVVAVFVVLRANPLATLFTWLATIAALSVMSLLAASCLAALGYFARTPRQAVPDTPDAEGFWTKVVGPLLGFVVGALVLGVTITHLDTLLAVAPGSLMTAVIPGLVVLAAVAGLAWALWLRERHPDVYQGIGAGKPHSLAVLDQRLADVEV